MTQANFPDAQTKLVEFVQAALPWEQALIRETPGAMIQLASVKKGNQISGSTKGKISVSNDFDVPPGTVAGYMRATCTKPLSEAA